MRLALKLHDIAPAHDVQRHQRGELLREVVVGIFQLGLLVCQDKYLARSDITLLKTYEPTKRALIQTRRGETDYGEQYLHGFVKSRF